jgi:hypothetical protein
VELFLALLKRRAQQALEAHRVPPPPILTASTDLSQGYESNVLLDGDKRGDFFTQETVSVTLRPRIRPWVSGELAYNLLNTHYTDLRDAKQIPAGNRFLVFTLFPKGNVEVRIFGGKEGKTTVVAVGHSIFNRTCGVNAGKLMAEYGGGGHAGAGTCQLAPADAERKIEEIIRRLQD